MSSFRPTGKEIGHSDEYYEKKRQKRDEIAVNPKVNIWSEIPFSKNICNFLKSKNRGKNEIEGIPYLSQVEKVAKSDSNRKSRKRRSSNEKGSKKPKDDKSHNSDHKNYDSKIVTKNSIDSNIDSKKVSTVHRTSDSLEQSKKRYSEEQGSKEKWNKGSLLDLFVEKKPSLKDSNNESFDVKPKVVVGPVPLMESNIKREIKIGKNTENRFVPGEGEGMADYLKQGKRIPRRGEIGLTGEEIQLFEKTGYVMSGSRNRRMEAMRMRKEAELYAMSEQNSLVNFKQEARKEKEEKILSDFKQLIFSSKLKKDGQH